MSTESSSPADEIAAALARLRGRRGGGRPRHPFGPHERGRHERDGHGPHFHPERGVHGERGTPAAMRMLDALASASTPLGVSELAEAIGVDQPRASRLVQQGVDQGWVRREADQADARRSRIALTADGERLVRGIRGERRERLSTALDAFSPEERTELARLLTKLADNWN